MEYFLDAANMTVLGALGFVTVFVTSVGGLVALRHWNFFRKADTDLARLLRWVFVTDAGIYLATMLFGVASWVGVDKVGDYSIFYGIRIVVMLANIWASHKLYQLYRRTHA